MGFGVGLGLGLGFEDNHENKQLKLIFHNGNSIYYMKIINFVAKVLFVEELKRKD